MRFVVNGKETDAAEGSTVGQLIDELRLNPDVIVVERNLTILPKEKWQETVLMDEDKLEIIAFVGGG